MEFHTFEVDGKEYTQKQLLDDLIDMAECILCIPENIKKNSKAWKRLSKNKYVLECNKLEEYSLEVLNDLEKRFWKIWSIVFPAMWW